MELQVLVHGIDVVKDVPGDTRNDSHQRRVVQIALQTHLSVSIACIVIHKVQLEQKDPLGLH